MATSAMSVFRSSFFSARSRLAFLGASLAYTVILLFLYCTFGVEEAFVNPYTHLLFLAPYTLSMCEHSVNTKPDLFMIMAALHWQQHALYNDQMFSKCCDEHAVHASFAGQLISQYHQLQVKPYPRSVTHIFIPEQR